LLPSTPSKQRRPHGVFSPPLFFFFFWSCLLVKITPHTNLHCSFRLTCP
jgi:hypothetical protein